MKITEPESPPVSEASKRMIQPFDPATIQVVEKPDKKSNSHGDRTEGPEWLDPYTRQYTTLASLRVIQMRNLLGMDWKTFAEACGISVYALRMIEQAKPADLPNYFYVCRALRIKPSLLLTDSPRKWETFLAEWRAVKAEYDRKEARMLKRRTTGEIWNDFSEILKREVLG